MSSNDIAALRWLIVQREEDGRGVSSAVCAMHREGPDTVENILMEVESCKMDPWTNSAKASSQNDRNSQ